MIRILIARLLISLSSCTCNYHLKKARGKCGYTSDTVFKTVTVTVPKVEKDTVFKYFQRDTVIVKEGRLTMRYYYNNHDSTVYLSGECDTVRVVKKVPVIVNKYKMSLPWYVKLVKWVLILLGLGIAVNYLWSKISIRLNKF